MNTIATRLRDDDEGFGLTEIVVSMFMLAILAMAFLPLLINGLKTSASTTTLATATQLLNQQMQKASAFAATTTTTCSEVTTALGATQSLVDPRNVTIQLTTVVGSCPTRPGTISVTSTARRTDTGVTLATGATLVFLP